MLLARPRPAAPRLAIVLGALAVTALSASAPPAHATTVAYATVEDLARASHLVALVTVTAPPAPRERDREAVTDVTVRVEATVRGEAPALSTLTIVLPGGTLPDRTDTVDGSPSVTPGVTYLAFLRRLPSDGPSHYFLTHLTAGLAPVARTPAGEVTVAPAPGMFAQCEAPLVCPAPARTTRPTALRFPFVALPALARALGQLR